MTGPRTPPPEIRGRIVRIVDLALAAGTADAVVENLSIGVNRNWTGADAASDRALNAREALAAEALVLGAELGLIPDAHELLIGRLAVMFEVLGCDPPLTDAESADWVRFAGRRRAEFFLDDAALDSDAAWSGAFAAWRAAAAAKEPAHV